MTAGTTPHAADGATGRRELRDYVCTHCGCACDDLTLTIEGRCVVLVEPPCPIAEAAFTKLRAQPPLPADCLIDGKPATFADALGRAVEILQVARAPLIFGMERTTCDAQRAAVELADRLGAYLDPTDDWGRSHSHAAVQTVGAVTATLGEVAARADLVVYWNVDPMATHPRHMERFAQRPLTARGTLGLTRRVLAVGARRSASAQASDDFLQIGPERDDAALAVLRALISGVSVDEAPIQQQTGAAIEQWAYLAQRLKMARYVAIFHDSQNAAAVTALVRDLHRHTRAVALRLGAPPNAAGATQVLAWQTGFPCAIDFGAGYPHYRPDEASAAKLLERNEVDAAMVIAADPLEHFSGAALDNLRVIPKIAFDHQETKTTAAAAVAFFTPAFGFETDGEIYRSDGIALPLRAALPCALPKVETILGELRQRLGTVAPDAARG